MRACPSLAGQPGPPREPRGALNGEAADDLGATLVQAEELAKIELGNYLEEPRVH
jgi:hypothetical protein